MLSESRIRSLVIVNKLAGLSFEAIYNCVGRVTNFTREELAELYSVSPSETCLNFMDEKM